MLSPKDTTTLTRRITAPVSSTVDVVAQFHSVQQDQHIWAGECSTEQRRTVSDVYTP